MHIRIGINVRGKPGMVVDRPHGSGDYVFIHFLAPAYLEQKTRVNADECIVYTPDAPTYICGDDAGIFNTYAHVSADIMQKLLHQYGVPTNTILALRSTEWILPLLSSLQREWIDRDRHWEAAVRLVTTDLVLHVARNHAPAPTSIPIRHAARLRAIRVRVHSSPQEPWIVPAMAELAGLKESRFTVLYKHLFGCTPMHDLIAVRIELAKYYLSNDALSIADVAELSGFLDVYYFSRCFRRYVGCAPSHFRHR